MTAEPRVGGRWFRVLTPRFAHEPLSGLGAQFVGGRYNRKGRGAMYLSADPQTAYAEYIQALYDRPGLMCGYDVDLGPVADLTDTAVLGRYDLSAEALADAWLGEPVPPGQVLSERLIAGGVAGALYPSAQRRGAVNLVAWRWNAPPASIRLIDRLAEAPTKPVR